MCKIFLCSSCCCYNPLPYQFVNELKEFECKVYSLRTCSDPSHLLSLSLLLLLSLLTWLTPFNSDTLSCYCYCSTINLVVLALLKCLTFGILLGSVVEEGDFSELREREG
jgi:hypothetical protein